MIDLNSIVNDTNYEQIVIKHMENNVKQLEKKLAVIRLTQPHNIFGIDGPDGVSLKPIFSLVSVEAIQDVIL